MDSFERPDWCQLQVVLWVCTASRGAVRIAADRRPAPRDLDDHQNDPPGFDDDRDLIADVLMPGGRIGKRWRSRLRPDCSFEKAEQEVLDALRRGCVRASGLRNGAGDRERIPQEQWTGLEFYWTKALREFRHHLPHSVNRSPRYVGPRDQLRHNATYWTDVFFKRDQVLALWPDPLADILRTERAHITLAGAVALLVRGRPALKKVWRRLRRRHGGRFPAAIQENIEEAGQEIVEMIRRRDVETWGRFCDRDQGSRLSGMAPITDNGSFLAEPLLVDPCEDVIRTEFARGAGQFDPVDQEYRDVVLNRTQFLKTIKLQRRSPQPERAAIGDTGTIQGYVQTTEPMATGAPGRPTSMHLVEAELDQRIAAAASWPNKTSAAEELSEWLRLNHKHAPQLTLKTIKNRLGYKIPISAKQ